MTHDNALLAFVKTRLEEGEGVSSEALQRLLAAAERETRRTAHRAFIPLLAAASLAIAAIGWFVCGPQRDAESSELANVIALLRTADGTTDDTAAETPADYLLAWQDAPALDADSIARR